MDDGTQSIINPDHVPYTEFIRCARIKSEIVIITALGGGT